MTYVRVYVNRQLLNALTSKLRQLLVSRKWIGWPSNRRAVGLNPSCMSKCP